MISVKFCMCELVSVHADWERVMFLNLGVCIAVQKHFQTGCMSGGAGSAVG